MAALERRGKSFRLVVRDTSGRQTKHALGKVHPDEAQEILLRFERRFRMYREGDLTVPDGEDLVPFLITGKATATPKPVTSVLTLAELFRRYEAELPPDSKERGTLITERHHMAHFRRLLGRNHPATKLNTPLLQQYIDRRSKEHGRRGEHVSQVTIKKELSTLRMINNWALHRELVDRPIHLRGLAFAKARPKHPFQTMEQVQRQIARGGLSRVEIDELWDSVFLSSEQIEQLLADVQQIETSPYIYPMFVFAAMTGARRSEMLRSRIDDFDFEGGFVRLREKKRDTSAIVTFRSVPIAPLLARVMKEWFRQHPGGPYTLTANGVGSLGIQTAAWAFRGTLNGTQWEKLHGWHTLRHSFCSNCASAAIDQRLINSFVGHSTVEMEMRYRHLFPEQQQRAIEAVYGEVRGG